MRVILGSIGVFVALACGHQQLDTGLPSNETVGDASQRESAGPIDVYIRAGDAVRVNIWREPDLSGEFAVAASGLVVLPLIGEKMVVGARPDTLERQLIAEYMHYLENPSIDVTLLRRIAVHGEVRNPGLYQVDASYTITDVLALAGGFSSHAKRTDIRLVREGQVVSHSLDAATLVGSSRIQSGDQVIVGQRSWFSRHLPVVTAGIGAFTSITIALFLR